MIDRRRFLKTLGLTGSAAMLDHCAPAPSEKLIPYLIAPDDITPGVPAYYATTCRECPAGCGMVAKVMDGRVIKAEGNPNNPISRGHLCARGQASVQSLYNPNRFGMPRMRSGDGTLKQISWEQAEATLAERLREAKQRGGNRIAWIGGLSTGSFDALLDEWLAALHTTRRIVYEPFDYEPLRAASELAFGTRAVPRYDFEQAQYVLSFGADFLETWISNVEFTAAYADLRRRAAADKASTFTWIAPHLSLTGMNSDEWIAARAGSEALAALAIADSIIAQGLEHPSTDDVAFIRRTVSRFSAERVQNQTGVDRAAIDRVARQFASAMPSLAVGGGISAGGDGHAVDLELAVLLLNVLAGNIGTTVAYGARYAFDRLSTREDIAELTRAMSAGQVDVLLVHQTDPAATLPPNIGFNDAIGRVPFVATFANRPDQTSEHAHLLLPDHHFLESWGDYTPRAGVLNLLQPAATPMLHSRATGDVLIGVARQVDGSTTHALATDWATYIRSRWQPEEVRAGGRVEDVSISPATLRDVSDALDRIAVDAPAADAVTLVAYPSAHFYDGRTASEPWLREVPDPVTTIVWRSWLEIHPDLARKLGVRDGDAVEIESFYGRATLPAHLSRRLRSDTVATPIGADRSTLAWRSGQVKLRRVPGQPRVIRLAAASDAAPTEFAADKSDHQTTGMYPPHSHPTHRWGMAIDLNTCTGCNACVVACYAENNIPVVGEERCAQGREMSWIRIERSDGAFVPMLCQQCDQAPCESVCPVTATYHNPEGLNAQVYNRCIGTRFCSNNCPYKVRRFNFQQPAWPAPLDRQLNPDVTVRSAGVMEKCTFCVQRIQAAKIDAKSEGRPLRDGDITPACAQTCAAEAIVFGDLHDPNSRVSQLARDARGFHVLEELNTHPAITYLRRNTPASTSHES